MYRINRNRAEEIFNKSDLVNTKIDQSENNLCLIFDFSSGEHLQMNYKCPDGEKTYYLLNDVN